MFLKVSPTNAKVSSEVEIKTDPDQMVVSLQEPQKEEEVPVEEEAAEGTPETESGAEPKAEGEAPKAEEVVKE